MKKKSVWGSGFFEKWVQKYRILRKENFEVFFSRAKRARLSREAASAEVVQRKSYSLKLHFSGRVNPFLPGAGADRRWL